VPSKKTLTLTALNDIYLLMSVNNINKAPKYIPIESIIEYADKGLTFKEIGNLLKCDASNVCRRLKTVNYTPERLKHYQDNKEKLMLWLQSELVNSIKNKDIKTMQPYQRVVAFGILEDKLKQMSAGSTGNINILNQIVINLDKSVRAELKSKGIQDVVIDVPHNEPKKLTP